MGRINFYCQNVNICLPPSFGMTTTSEKMSKGYLDYLNVTCPQVMHPTAPVGNYPTYENGGCSQQGLPIYPGANFPELAPPIFTGNGNTNLPEISGAFSAKVEEEIFELVNIERANYGLAPVGSNSALSDVARRKSLNMGDLGYFSHTAPNGTTTADWLRNEGQMFSGWGENIANFGANATAIEIMNGWMNSPGHRANILNPDFMLLGVGVYLINDRTFATQVFGR